jgi:tetratricopeptide (TPR) repeat protein
MKRKVYFGVISLAILFSLHFVFGIETVRAQTKKQIQNAQKLWEQGENLYRQKKFMVAIQKYDEAIKVLSPFPYPSAYFSRGWSHYSLNQYERAITDFTTALNQRQPALQVYKIRSLAYYQIKDYDSALKDVEEVLKVDTSDANLYLVAGDIYRMKNNDKDALSAYMKAAEFQPNNADLQYFIALLHSKSGDFVPQGIAALNAVQKGTKYQGEAWLLLGDSLQKSKKYSEAVEAYERALSAKPTMIELYATLTQLYYQMNRLDEAIKTAQQGLKVNPEEGVLYISLSWYYSLLDKNQEAIAAARQAVRILPQQPMGYTNLCRAYKDIKQYDLAIKTCNDALALQPNDGETYLYMGQSYDFLKKGDLATSAYKKAVAGLTDFTKNNPEDADGFYLLGTAYYLNNQISSAINSYKKCLTLKPQFVRSIYNLGYMYVLSKDKASARLQYNELVKLNAEYATRLLKEIEGN